MSYTIHLESTLCPHCKRCGSEPYCPDPTYNLTPIFDLALMGGQLPNPDTTEMSVVLLGTKTDRPRGLRLLNGKTGADSVPMLRAALTRLQDERMRSQFKALEPENGWGDLPGAIKVMTRLLDLAKEYLTNVWNVR